MNETDAHVAIITESWLKDGKKLESDKQDISLGAGLGLLCKNRKPNPNVAEWLCCERKKKSLLNWWTLLTRMSMRC